MQIGRSQSGIQIDRRSLVETASELVNISSPTGDEYAMAEHMARVFHDMGLQVQWQEVEEGRPNVLGTWRGTGGGKTLMFNGHMDTSYSGREPWLGGKGFKPEARVEGDYIFGLGISNMKGALACYVEAVRALQAAGVRLRGDVLIAAVVGEIEKTQWGDEFRGKEYRGYAAGSRYLVTHGGVADMCLLGEPTEGKVVLGHYGSIWLRISTRGPFVHTAFSGGRQEENSILRMRQGEGVDQPGEERHGRDQEDGDLGARGERDLRGELDLAAGGDDDGAAVLGRVADDGDDHGRDEEVRQAGLVGEHLDRADEDLGDDRRRERGDPEDDERRGERPAVRSSRRRRRAASGGGAARCRCDHVDDQQHDRPGRSRARVEMPLRVVACQPARGTRKSTTARATRASENERGPAVELAPAPKSSEKPRTSRRLPMTLPVSEPRTTS